MIRIPWKDLTDKERRAIGDVCGQYNHVGLLIRRGTLPWEYLDELGNTPNKCFEVACEYLKELRSEPGNQWRLLNFDWLVDQLPEVPPITEQVQAHVARDE